MSTPPAWHPDPTGRHDHRWWDGERWTEHVADAGQSSVDPLEGATSPQQDAATGAGTDAGAGDAAAESGGLGDAGAWAGAVETPDIGGPADADPALTADSGAPPAADVAPVAPVTPGWEQPGSADPGQAWQQPGASDPSQTWQQPGAADPGQTWQQAGIADSGQAAQQQDWQGGAMPAAPTWQQASTTPAAAPSKLPLAAMIVGLVSLPGLILCGLGAISGIVAIVLGFIGLGKIKRQGGSKGFAWTGIVSGAVALAIGVAVVTMLTSSWMRIADCVEQTGDEELCAERFADDLVRRFGG